MMHENTLTARCIKGTWLYINDFIATNKHFNYLCILFQETLGRETGAVVVSKYGALQQKYTIKFASCSVFIYCLVGVITLQPL